MPLSNLNFPQLVERQAIAFGDYVIWQDSNLTGMLFSDVSTGYSVFADTPVSLVGSYLAAYDSGTPLMDFYTSRTSLDHTKNPFDVSPMSVYALVIKSGMTDNYLRVVCVDASNELFLNTYDVSGNLISSVDMGIAATAPSPNPSNNFVLNGNFLYGANAITPNAELIAFNINTNVLSLITFSVDPSWSNNIYVNAVNTDYVFVKTDDVPHMWVYDKSANLVIEVDPGINTEFSYGNIQVMAANDSNLVASMILNGTDPFFRNYDLSDLTFATYTDFSLSQITSINSLLIRI